MKNTVLFDLGNTLVAYYAMRSFPAILRASITEAAKYTGSEEITKVIWQRVQDENVESSDYCVRPLEGRLQRIFQVPEADEAERIMLCRAFMGPIFACASLYGDVIPTLSKLREREIQTAIVSNTPWGSPSVLWREEMTRLGLAEMVDHIIFCRDCGGAGLPERSLTIFWIS